MLTISAAQPAAEPVVVPERPACGLSVLLDPGNTLPLAGYLLRHGAALALARAPLPPAVHVGFGGAVVPAVGPDMGPLREALVARALEAATAAGFDPLAAETYHEGLLEERLRSLSSQDVTCIAVASTRPQHVRRIARAANAPVLALPPNGVPAGGPAVIDAGEADAVLTAAARALATEKATIVGTFDPVLPDTMLRRSRPVSTGELLGLSRDVRRVEVEGAWMAAEGAAVRARALGLDPDTLTLPARNGVINAARAHEGIVVALDRDGWRAPSLLRDALADNRACLLVPLGEAGEG